MKATIKTRDGAIIECRAGTYADGTPFVVVPPEIQKEGYSIVSARVRTANPPVNGPVNRRRRRLKINR